jgi:putative flippase GtrA
MISAEVPSRFAFAKLLGRPGPRQVFRYVIAGFCVSQLAALIYSSLTLFGDFAPLVANLLSTACGVSAGYLIHNKWSFADGSAPNDTLKMARFLTGAFIAFAVNTTWVWLFVSLLGLSALAPVPLMMFVTPWVSFFVNRHWVFKAA